MKLSAKYMPYVDPTFEDGTRCAPMRYFEKELHPTLRELGTDEVWDFALQFLAEVEGMDDFMVLMEICARLAGRETLHVGRADVFVHRIADPALGRPKFAGFMRELAPGVSLTSEMSWRGFGAWIVYALHEPLERSGTESGERVGHERLDMNLEREIPRRVRELVDVDGFVDVSSLIAEAMNDTGSFVQNRTLADYCFALPVAVIHSYPRADRPHRNYAELSWRHLAWFLGMALVLDLGPGEHEAEVQIPTLREP